MNRQSTLPTAAEQTRHALLLLGAPAPARLVVDLHAALFDGDLSVAAVAGLLRARAPGFAAALDPDLTAARGMVALADWPVGQRIVTPARHRADTLAMVVRITEFVAVRPHADRSAQRLLRTLALGVPHGPEALDLREAARDALTGEELIAAVAAEATIRAAAALRADELDEQQRLFGVPAVPRQRGPGGAASEPAGRRVSRRGRE